MTEDRDDEAQAAYASGTWATAALAAAFCLVLGSSLIDLNRANGTLVKVEQAQATAAVSAKRGEAQLNALADGVQRLADAGNPNAATIVGVLRRNGLRIDLKHPAAAK